MSAPQLSNLAARRLFLDRHALLEPPAGAAQGADLLELITRLGFVQLDSINTVARAHDLILFSRRPRYRPAALKRLHERDGALFEHWTHDAAIIPREFYPWWHLRMARDAEQLISRWRNWQRHEFEAEFHSVLDHIRENGPCCASDLGGDEPKNSGGWWNWHPSKTALEYLWRSGALTVVGRRGFQKRYDLTERVIDEAHRNSRPDEAATIDWCCNAALDRLGFATSGELAAFWRHVTVEEAREWCRQALSRGEIEEICIFQADGKPRKCFARPGVTQDPAIDTPPPPRLRVLSPFDPALRDRNRARRLFGFDYSIEVFVPEEKRQYGYYVFPILEGDRIVGRVDMKAYRDRDALHVRALWPEPGVRWGKLRTRAFEAEVQRLTRLAGVSQVTWDADWMRAD